MLRTPASEAASAAPSVPDERRKGGARVAAKVGPRDDEVERSRGSGGRLALGGSVAKEGVLVEEARVGSRGGRAIDEDPFGNLATLTIDGSTSSRPGLGGPGVLAVKIAVDRIVVPVGDGTLERELHRSPRLLERRQHHAHIPAERTELLVEAQDVGRRCGGRAVVVDEEHLWACATRGGGGCRHGVVLAGERIAGSV